MVRLTGALSALVLFPAAVAACAQGTADPPPAKTPPAAAAEERELEYFRARMRRHRLAFPDRPEQPFRLVEEPLMRFDNPVSRIDDGFMFLWTHGGRPVATAKSYYHTPYERWGRTFVSLAERPIVMRIDEQAVWTPQEAGVTFAPLDNVPPPADDPRRRLIQMRAIAKQFEVIDNWGLTNPTDWELRLLTTPLYRYTVPAEDVVDAALFGYVLTTSPEALLLLEARRTTDGLQWHYAVSRCTRFGITFSRDGREVAAFPRLDAWPADGTYFHIPQQLPEYPYKDDGTP